MKYAHIYKVRGGKFQLLLTTGPEISTGVLSELLFDSKADAKKAAKAAGAVAHNY